MSSDHMSSDHKVIQELERNMQQLSTYTILFHQKIAQQLDLNPTDHKCLDLIMKNGLLTAGKLAQRTGLTTGAITGVIDRLERKKLVTREKDPNDRRKIIVVANKEKAIQEIGPLFSSLHSSMHRLFEEYSHKELQIILDYITKCVKLMQQEVEILSKAPKAHRGDRK